MNPKIDGIGRGLPSALAALCAIALALLGVLIPLSTDCPPSPNRDTHLLCAARAAGPITSLLLVGVPLLLFAAVIAANQVILFSGSRAPSWARTLSRSASLAVGPIVVGLAAFATTHVVAPHTSSGGWLGTADVTSSIGYVLLVVPAVVVTLTELRVLGVDRRQARQLNGVAAIAGLLLTIVVVTAASMSTQTTAHTPITSPLTSP